jgi:hypothetical protein
MRSKTAIAAGLALVAIGCDRPRVTPSYDPKTGVLVRLDDDYNADGKVDLTTFMKNGRAARLEADTDGDGRVDRWEYYAANGTLERIGGSRGRDGREDSWAYPAGRDLRIDISTARDGAIDRREFYRDGALVRVERDTNHDGLIDVWEEYDRGRLAAWLADEQKRSGRPTRRIAYATGGAPRVETVDTAGASPLERRDAAR